MATVTTASEPTMDRQLRWHFGWNFETTKAHFKDHPPVRQDQVLVVSTQGGILSYEMAEVEKITKTRIYLHKAFGWAGLAFYYTGQNCFSPKGQTRMIPINDEIKKYFEKSGSKKIEISTLFQDQAINEFLEACDAKF